MFAYGYVNSLEQDIMSASPAQLVGMLYQGALDAVNAARPHLWAGEIAQRSRQLTRAQMILSRLRQGRRRREEPRPSLRLYGKTIDRGELPTNRGAAPGSFQAPPEPHGSLGGRCP